jgi:DUF1680 family protein
MRITLLFVALFIFRNIPAQLITPDYSIQPIPFQNVKITDRFWGPRMETVRKVTVPATFRKNEETGRNRNFAIAAGSQEGAFCTHYAFDDSDVYKAIEGAAYAMRTHPDQQVIRETDSLIARIALAQEPDGYLYTWRTIADKQKKNGQWTEEDKKKQNLVDADKGRWSQEDQASHELYNAGHLYEAAVAWQEATGHKNLLDIALKNAELVLQSFGPGKLQKAPGHQEVELGLVKLYRHTGDKRYLDLAQFFLDVRGYGDPYQQNHQKVKDQREAVGHAVRAGYMFAAACDVSALKGTNAYKEALTAVWDDIVLHKMYITGGIGASGSNEGFASPYDLPNYSAYCETCSSIAFAMWCRRMFQLTGESKYIDILERTLYNALNAGLSLSGDAFFYPNPLESRKNVERVPWFTCACCPPNLTRFFSALPEYFYAKNGNDFYINLFGASNTTIENINSAGQKVKVNIRQETDYPWDGMVRVHIEPAKPNTFTLRIRIPGWAKGDAVPGDLYRFFEFSGAVTLRLNGKSIVPTIENGYAVINRKWAAGDVVELSLPMQVQRIAANQKIEPDLNRFAFQRGPLLYCLEGKDQSDDHILNILVPDTAVIGVKTDPQLFNGITALYFRGYLVNKIISPEQGDLKPINLKAIPYFMWANRGKDNMLVWLPHDLRAARALAQPTLAHESKMTSSEGLKGDITAVADQYSPKDSNDQENPFVHWWPKFGSKEWLQYDFKQPEQIGTARIYWFDDERTGGGCRVPKSWTVQYLEGDTWKNVYAPGGFPVVKDGWNEVQFEPVKTKALRLEVQLQEGVSAGVHEWEVK